MEVSLLGSGEAVGVPAPLCDCRYCDESAERRRPGLLVQTDEAAIVLDVSPDIKNQLHKMSPPTIDAFFVTHHHFDHVGGLHELNHAAMGFDAHVGIEGGSLAPDSFSDSEKPSDPEFAVYLTQTALEHVEDANPHLTNSIDFRTVDHDTIVEIGEMRVVPFPVRHGRPQFDTLGFAVYHDDSKVVYAPDMWEFMGGTEYRGADLLFAESSALFRAFGHGKESDLRSALRDAKAERTVLINLNEHLQRMTTSELRNSVREMDVADELGEDFATYNL